MTEKSLPTVVFLTALPLEREAVVEHLAEVTHKKYKGTVYDVGNYSSSKQKWRIIVTQTGDGNNKSGIEAERAFEHFKPNYAFFVGIAGGVKDVSLGDVVAASFVRGYEKGKSVNQGVLSEYFPKLFSKEVFYPRGDVYRSSHELVQCAPRVKKENWVSKIKRASERPIDNLQSFIAPIAGGEQVVTERTQLHDFLRKHMNDVLAVEMEGLGFLNAVDVNKAVDGIVIRGISDLLSKTASHDKTWQPIAAQNAAAFAFAMLDMLDELEPLSSIAHDKEEQPGADSGEQKLVSSLIVKLSQEDRNQDSYDLQVWLTDHKTSLYQVHGPQRHKKSELPIEINKSINKILADKKCHCDEDFVIEVFLPKELLKEPIGDWIIDVELEEKLGAAYQLVIRSTERFENDDMFRRLSNCWSKYKKRLDDPLKTGYQHRCCSNGEECKSVFGPNLSDEPIALFVLDFPSEMPAVIFKCVQWGPPFLLWPTDDTQNCQPVYEQLAAVQSLTFAQLPKQLKQLRAQGLQGLSLLWDNPDRQPPFSKFSPYTAPK